MFAKQTAETVKFRPEFANCSSRQGINREFCGYLLKPKAIKHLMSIFGGFRKLSGIKQGILCNNEVIGQPLPFVFLFLSNAHSIARELCIIDSGARFRF